MRALDFHIDGERVTRLQALQSVVGDFVREREGDRMGLVVFGSEVFTQCPLTKDIGVLSDFVSTLEIGMAGEGTALGDGTAIGLKRLKEIETDSKVLVLVTDGLQTAGKMNPLDAAAIAKQMGVKIYSIGIGGVGAAPFPSRTLFGFETLSYKDVPLDVETLTDMAKMTGGKYFHAKSTEELVSVYDEIDSLEERVETKFEHIEYEERYWWFLLSGVILFFLAESLRASYFRVIPE
jgi:Ca-activated chloride channel family protein